MCWGRLILTTAQTDLADRLQVLVTEEVAVSSPVNPAIFYFRRTILKQAIYYHFGNKMTLHLFSLCVLLLVAVFLQPCDAHGLSGGKGGV